MLPDLKNKIESNMKRLNKVYVQLQQIIKKNQSLLKKTEHNDNDNGLKSIE
jgi:hypothetical protein